MYKKITAIALALVFVFSFAACGRTLPYDDYDLEEYITVGNYEGMEVEKYTIEVTDEEVEEEINNRLQLAATTSEVEEGVVEDGDTIIIDFVGRIDGEEFEGGSAQNYSLTVGAGQFVDGFESGLLGAEVGGDPVVVKATFPEDYALNQDLAGKEAEFTVTVHAKQVTTVPELNMDFVAAQGSEATTIDEYKEEVKQELYTQKEEAAIDQQKAYLWNKLVEDTEQKTGDDGEPLYPEAELERVTNQFVEEYKTYADQYGMEYGDFIKQQTGMSEEEFNDQIKEYAKSVVLQEMVLYYMVDKAEIKITKDEYDDYIEKQLNDMGMDADSFEAAYGKSFEDYMTEDMIRRNIYLDKVTALLLESAVQVDELSEPEEAETPEDAESTETETTEAEDGE